MIYNSELKKNMNDKLIRKLLPTRRITGSIDNSYGTLKTGKPSIRSDYRLKLRMK